MTVNYSNNFVDPYKKFMQMSAQAVPTASSELPALGSVSQTPVIKVGDIDDESKGGKTGHKKIFGIIGISTGLAGLLTLIALASLSKGFAGGLSKNLSKFSKSLQKKIYDISVETKELTKSQKIRLQISKSLQKVADAIQASSNITAVKDSWFRNLLKKMKLEPVVKKLNNVFKNVVTKNTKNYYTKAETSNLKFCSYLDDLAQKAKDPKTKDELINFAKKLRELYKNNFTTAEHFERTNKAFKEMYGLDEKVYEKLFVEGGFFKNLKKYKSYITTDLVSKERKALIEKLLANKNNLSNNVNDNYNNIKQILNEIKINVNPRDEKSVSAIKKLSETLESYKTASGPQEKEIRKKLCQVLKSEMEKISEFLQNEKNNASKFEKVQTKIAEFYSAIDPRVAKKGVAQDTITYIKETFGKNSPEYKQAKEYMTVLNNNLNNAIKSEINSFEKLAELQVGSVPTDIAGIIAPATLATGLVVSADNKEERISKTLTKGIPILGGVASTYYGTTRGFTGARNLALGIGTTWLLNLIGSKTDEFYKKYVEKQNVLRSAFEAFTKLQNKSAAQK